MARSYYLKLSNGCKHPYCIHHSVRAKRLSLKLSATGELRIVLPKGQSAALAHAFVTDQIDWVEKHLQKISKKQPANDAIEFPDRLELQMLGETWTIDYSDSTSNIIEYRELANHHLQLKGARNSVEYTHKILGLFLKNKANYIFPELLEQLATQYGFNYSAITVRGQKSRWGSCSSKKRISMNYKLLFLPEKVARYVFIHELCHTVELNHSRKFWQLVERCDPDYKQHDQSLKRYGHIIRHF